MIDLHFPANHVLNEGTVRDERICDVWQQSKAARIVFRPHPVGKCEHGKNHFGVLTTACRLLKLSGFNCSFHARPFRCFPGHSAPPDSDSKKDENEAAQENGSNIVGHVIGYERRPSLEDGLPVILMGRLVRRTH